MLEVRIVRIHVVQEQEEARRAVALQEIERDAR